MAFLLPSKLFKQLNIETKSIGHPSKNNDRYTRQEKKQTTSKCYQIAFIAI